MNKDIQLSRIPADYTLMNNEGLTEDIGNILIQTEAELFDVGGPADSLRTQTRNDADAEPWWQPNKKKVAKLKVLYIDPVWFTTSRLRNSKNERMLVLTDYLATVGASYIENYQKRQADRISQVVIPITQKTLADFSDAELLAEIANRLQSVIQEQMA